MRTLCILVCPSALNHRWPENNSHKGPAMWRFDFYIMIHWPYSSITISIMFLKRKMNITFEQWFTKTKYHLRKMIFTCFVIWILLCIESTHYLFNILVYTYMCYPNAPTLFPEFVVASHLIRWYWWVLFHRTITCFGLLFQNRAARYADNPQIVRSANNVRKMNVFGYKMDQ